MDAKLDTRTANKSAGKCPMSHRRSGRSNRDWWPDQLSLQGLNQHARQSNSMGEGFDYATELKTLDLKCRDQGPTWADD